MAYMNQERKASINSALKQIVPASWKWSLSVRHHSTIVFTLRAAPVDLLAMRAKKIAEEWERKGMGLYKPETYAQVNHYYLSQEFDGEALAIFEKINEALNAGNHDRSDIQTDYFDVGWYVDIRLGEWNKPFQVLVAA